MITWWTTKKVSPVGYLNKEDVRKTITNGIVFLGPTLLVLLPALFGLIPKDAWYYAIAMWVLKVLTELITRLLQEK